MAGPSKPTAPPKASELREKQAVARSGALRVNGGFLPERAFAMRRTYFTAAVGIGGEGTRGGPGQHAACLPSVASLAALFQWAAWPPGRLRRR